MRRRSSDLQLIVRDVIGLVAAIAIVVYVAAEIACRLL